MGISLARWPGQPGNGGGQRSQRRVDPPDKAIALVEILGRNPNRKTELSKVGRAVETAWSQEARRQKRRRYQVVTGSGQFARRNTPLAVEPTIKVTDGFGRPVSVEVQFAVKGGGTIDRLKEDTNPQTGTASCGRWTLGPSAGANAVVARVGNMVVAVFRAVAI
jgi:hypothetical protein